MKDASSAPAALTRRGVKSFSGSSESYPSSEGGREEERGAAGESGGSLDRNGDDADAPRRRELKLGCDCDVPGREPRSPPINRAAVLMLRRERAADGGDVPGRAGAASDR